MCDCLETLTGKDEASKRYYGGLYQSVPRLVKERVQEVLRRVEFANWKMCSVVKCSLAIVILDDRKIIYRFLLNVCQ